MTVKAPAGLGKTTLLEHTIARAVRAGHRVRTAAPSPQERHFAYGVMRTLLEAPLYDTDDAERTRLLDGAAALAGDLLLRGTAPGPDATTAIAHSMLWLCTSWPRWLMCHLMRSALHGTLWRRRACSGPMPGGSPTR